MPPTVGYRTFETPDAVQGASVPVHLLYASDAPARDQRFGRYTLAVARDAPMPAADAPLVVVSHGTGSTPWLLRDLAVALTRTGCVVALVEHPGNRLGDDALAGTPANLANRPRHLRLVIDALGATRAAVIGHSLGGYTALAVAGGHPVALPEQTPDGVAHPVAVVPDPRVRALVLLAPAVPWFMAPGALADVLVPIFLRVGERDAAVPADFTAGLVRRGVRDPSRLDVQTVANAGHFSFTSPFPPDQIRPELPPSQDPPGFDRAAYQPILHAEIVAFLRAAGIVPPS